MPYVSIPGPRKLDDSLPYPPRFLKDFGQSGWAYRRGIAKFLTIEFDDDSHDVGITNQKMNEVADFHTYFVGRRAVMVHDNTPRRPTLSIVPGLSSLEANVRE